MDKTRIQMFAILCLHFTSWKSIHEVKLGVERQMRMGVPYNILWGTLFKLEKDGLIVTKKMPIYSNPIETSESDHYRLSNKGLLLKMSLKKKIALINSSRP